MVAVAASTPAAAAAAFVSDCSFWPQETFYRNQPVCVSGDLDYVPPGHIVPTADIYVTANTTWSDGDAAIDVTGSPNRFQSYGTFYDEYAWLPTLQAGRYDILIDNDLNGTWDPAHDILLGDGTDYAFDVIGDDLAGYTFDSAALKAEGQAQVGGWQTLARSSIFLSGASSVGVSVDAYNYASAAGWRFPLAYAGGVGGGTFIPSLFDLTVPTSAHDGVLFIGGRIIDSLAGTQAQHYQNLADDPADPAYGRAVGLDMAVINDDFAASLSLVGLDESYPFSPLDSSAEHARQGRIATLSAEQAALVEAIMHAHERYLGAQQADDVRWAVAHASALEQYTSQLVTNQDELVDLLEEVRDEIALLPDAATPVDVSALEDLQDRVATSGFTAQEIADYESVGYASADAQVVADHLAAIELPDDDVSLLDAYDGVIDAADDLQAAFTDAADEAAARVATMNSAVQAVSVPSVTVATPTQPLNAGTASTLSASASGGTGGLTVTWDLDLDGVFDDESGTSTSFTPAMATDQLVGTRVTDARGMISTAYTRIESSEASQVATIDTQSPASAHVTITGGDSQTFTVSATDPESATVTYQWFLDDTPVGTGTSDTYDSTLGERSIHAVSVQASDGDPTHRHPEARWALTTLP